MSTIAVEADSAELEALFDSIARVPPVPARAAAPQAGAEPAPKTKTRAKAKAKARAEPKAGAKRDKAPTESVINRIGHLTRTLHDALRQLGYDRVLEKTAAAIPDARDRLDYVAQMTEQAAVRALNAIEAARPIQDRLGDEAERLAAQWQRLYDRQLNLDEFKVLAAGTRAYLADVPTQARATNAQLLEIMMAQDFQDLTGQVIKKITALAQDMEQQLVHLLVDLAPADVRGEIDTGLLNGPVVNTAGRSDVMTDQNQVDDLLESLGF